ncbi:MAG: phosphomannomutase [Kiritimatiellia bacterium]|jgi:phosphomannomutase
MKGIRLASFGIRGFIGESLSPRILMDFACAFGTFNEGRRILVGRDTRYSSDMLHECVIAGLISCGCEIIDFGICPAPILQYNVQGYQAAGAISISGGHNGSGWNALTLIGNDGAYLNPQGGQIVLDYYHAANFNLAAWDGMGSLVQDSNFSQPYFEALAAFLDVDAIRARNFTVLIDPVGGAGCAFLEPFAALLGLKLIPVNGEPSGYLARDPEPRPRTARHLCGIIGHVGGDVGFVLNSDMSRLSLVTETGEPASEEYTFPLIADHVLRKQSGIIVTNTCTTRTLDAVANSRESQVVKTAVGQAHVLARLIDEDGMIGGEGNGSVAVPAFSRAFDGFLMMGLVLEAMVKRQKTVSELLAELPRYHVVKQMYACSSSDAYHALDRLRIELLEDPEILAVDLTDGVRVDWLGVWVHARASRTEQSIRIISEATTMALAKGKNDFVRRILDL